MKRKESLLLEVMHNLLKLYFESVPILISNPERTPCLKNTQYVISTISLVLLAPNQLAMALFQMHGKKQIK